MAQGHDLTLIETMQLGDVGEDRPDRFLPLTGVQAQLKARFRLSQDPVGTGGSARYWRIDDGMTRIGFISPMTANCCDGCNRVRLTKEGKFHTCLGHDDARDLRRALRDGGIAALDAAIRSATIVISTL